MAALLIRWHVALWHPSGRVLAFAVLHMTPLTKPRKTNHCGERKKLAVKPSENCRPEDRCVFIVHCKQEVWEMRKGRPSNISCTIPEKGSAIVLSIPGISVPPLAKVSKSRHDKSSLVEAVINPSSNLKVSPNESTTR